MYPFSGFRARNLYRILASIIMAYNYVLTNAKVTYVPLPGKYMTPNVMLNNEDLETCQNKTEYPHFVACYLMFSPSRKICSLFLVPSCDNAALPFLLKDYTKDDTTVYMRVTDTSSSTVDPTSQSLSVSPTITNFMSTFVPTVTSTNGDATLGPSISDHIAPTPTGSVSQSVFESSPETTYQEMVTTSIETSDSAQLTSDLPEVTSSPGTKPASETVSAEITAGFSLFTSVVSTSSESLCRCKCQPPPLTGQDLESSIASLRNELSVNKSTLSRTIRSKTSAPDDRPSATCIGMTGIVILVACLVLLVVSDLQLLCQHLKIMK